MSSVLSISLAFGQVILVRYVASSLLVIGILGSMLNIFIFSQRKFRTNSCCIYFLSLSISFIIVILIGIIPQLYAIDHSPNPLFNKPFCKARAYISQSSAMLSRWLLTIACIDRCLLTSTNIRLRSFSTLRIARKIIVILVIIWLIFPIHTILYTDVRQSGYIQCMMTTNFMAFYHSIYTIILGGLLPPLIMLISTKILWKSLQSKRERQRQMILNSRETKREKRDLQILIMLLLQVMIFILFTLPYMSFNLYLAATRSVINKTADRLSIESFMQLFTEMTLFVHPAFAFYINILASKTFRHQFIHILSCIYICTHAQRLRRRRRIDHTTRSAISTRPDNLPMAVVH